VHLDRDQGRSGKGIPLQALASTSGISAVAIQDWQMSRGAQTCFNLIDIDGSGSITIAEFQKFGFIFNISTKVIPHCFVALAEIDTQISICWRGHTVHRQACQEAFREFDVDNSKELGTGTLPQLSACYGHRSSLLDGPGRASDYEEFQMFCLVCLDKQHDLEKSKKLRLPTMQHKAVKKLHEVAAVPQLPFVAFVGVESAVEAARTWWTLYCAGVLQTWDWAKKACSRLLPRNEPQRLRLPQFVGWRGGGSAIYWNYWRAVASKWRARRIINVHVAAHIRAFAAHMHIRTSPPTRSISAVGRTWLRTSKP
jgi:hypothetical protein